MGTKGKWLGNLETSAGTVSFRATDHALVRMSHRKVSEYAVMASVIAVGPEVLAELKATGEELIVIDSEQNVAVVAGFKGNTLWVITVINRSNVYVKSGTRIEKIGG